MRAAPDFSTREPTLCPRETRSSRAEIPDRDGRPSVQFRRCTRLIVLFDRRRESCFCKRSARVPREQRSTRAELVTRSNEVKRNKKRGWFTRRRVWDRKGTICCVNMNREGNVMIKPHNASLGLDKKEGLIFYIIPSLEFRQVANFTLPPLLPLNVTVVRVLWARVWLPSSAPLLCCLSLLFHRAFILSVEDKGER